MRSFLQYLLEQNTESPASYGAPQDNWLEEKGHELTVKTDAEGPGITTHHYTNEEFGVSRKIHVWTDKEGITRAYTGWANIAENGTIEDSSEPQINIDRDLKKAKSNAAFEHLAHFAKNNPHITEILYMTDDTPAGARSRSRNEKFWPNYQKIYDISTRLVGVPENPLYKFGIKNTLHDESVQRAAEPPNYRINSSDFIRDRSIVPPTNGPMFGE